MQYRDLMSILSLFGFLTFCNAEITLSRRDVAILADMLKGGNGHGHKLYARQNRAPRTPWRSVRLPPKIV